MGQLRNRFPQADILPLKRLSHLQAALTHLSGSLQDLRQGGPMWISSMAKLELMPPFCHQRMFDRLRPTTIEVPVTFCLQLPSELNKKLSYRRGTARFVVSIEILPIAMQQCRNYLYDKSMVWSWRFSRRQCVIDNVHSTMTRPSRLPLSQVS